MRKNYTFKMTTQSEKSQEAIKEKKISIHKTFEDKVSEQKGNVMNIIHNQQYKQNKYKQV